jgi:hypothetical protein
LGKLIGAGALNKYKKRLATRVRCVFNGLIGRKVLISSRLFNEKKSSKESYDDLTLN